jgi:hypothetical protein
MDTLDIVIYMMDVRYACVECFSLVFLTSLCHKIGG